MVITRTTAGPAAPALRALLRMEFLQFGELIGGENFFHLGLHFRFEAGDLRFLVVGELEFLGRTRRQHMKAAAGPVLTGFRARGARRITGGRCVLSHEETGGGAESQREEGNFGFHNMLFYCELGTARRPNPEGGDSFVHRAICSIHVTKLHHPSLRER